MILQIWDLEFKIPFMQLCAEAKLDVSVYDLWLPRRDTSFDHLSLTPVNAHSSQGRLRFTMGGDTIDIEKARTYSSKWVQRNLADMYLVVNGRDLKPEFREPTLVNRKDLGPLPTTQHQSHATDMLLVGSLNLSDVEKSLAMVDTMRRDTNKDGLLRSLRWLRKASRSSEVVDRFVMLWIAFNAFYRALDQNETGEKTAIQNLIMRYPSIEKIREILVSHDVTVKTLASRDLWDRRRRTNYSADLRSLMETEADPRIILQKVCLCLYTVRNSIFHGGAKPRRDTDFVKACSGLLMRIHRECFRNYLDSKKAPILC
jgi:hypothetical protein